MTTDSSDPGERRPAVFFDRDGVVNRSPGDAYYVTSWDQFEFSPGFFEAFKFVKEHGWLVILVTSQKGVGKGLMSQADLDEIHAKMQAGLRAETGFEFDGIYAFTGTPDCSHQPKPDPEMILTAAREHEIDLENSWIVGDADRDIAMGIAAGVKGTIRVQTENPITVEASRTISTVEALTGLLAQVL